MISIVRVPSLPLVLTKADNHFRAHDARRGENIDDFQAARFGRAGGVQTNSKEGASASALQTFVEQYSAASLSLLPRTLDAPGGASSVGPMGSGGAVGFGTRSPYGGSLSKSESSPGSKSPSHSRLASSPGSNSPSHSLLVSSLGSNSPFHSLLASSLGSNSPSHSLLASSPSPSNTNFLK